MKKTIFISGIAAVLVIAAVAAVSVSRNSNESAMNDVTLANIEALAQESSSTTCSGNKGVCSLSCTVCGITVDGTSSLSHSH
jgi:hypothetical protein